LHALAVEKTYISEPSTMLRSAGTDIKVQQELLRHANIQTTMNIYTQAVSDQKRVANSKVVEMVFTGVKAARGKQSSANGSVTGADCDPANLPQTASSD
jgi:hypothetical protein